MFFISNHTTSILFWSSRQSRPMDSKPWHLPVKFCLLSSRTYTVQTGRYRHFEIFMQILLHLEREKNPRGTGRETLYQNTLLPDYGYFYGRCLS